MERTFGLDGWWTCVQVDAAVIALGIEVENRLNEFDDDGKPKHTLDDILKGKPKQKLPNNIIGLAGFLSVGKPVKRV